MARTHHPGWPRKKRVDEGMPVNRNTADVRRRELMNLLLQRIPFKECAQRLGVDPRSINRYMNLPGFREELEARTREIQDQATKTLAREMIKTGWKAIAKLDKLIDHDYPSIALKACDSVLDRIQETARNHKVDGDMQARFQIDPVTLMHAAATSREMMKSYEVQKQDRSQNYQQILPADAYSEEGVTSGEKNHERTGKGIEGVIQESRPDSPVVTTAAAVGPEPGLVSVGKPEWKQ